jgi:hypothetical protein
LLATELVCVVWYRRHYFMAAGIHAEEFGGRDTPNAGAMKTVFAAAGEMPTAVMRHLVW